MTSKTIKTILFASLIVAMILPFSGMSIDAFGERSEKSKEQLQAIFGDDYELAKEYHEKDTKVKELKQKNDKSEAVRESKNNAEVDRALDLGKLNARGYMTFDQLENTIETGIPIWDTNPSEVTETVSTTSVVYNSDIGITYVCSCNDKHVDFVGGYVYYTHWGLWKHTEFGTSDHISYSKTLGGSDTVVLDDYSQTIYPFVDYLAHGGATGATFEVDYETTDASGDTIVYQNNVIINDASTSWKTKGFTSVSGGQSEENGKVSYDMALYSIS
jgi:hypothetical protein